MGTPGACSTTGKGASPICFLFAMLIGVVRRGEGEHCEMGSTALLRSATSHWSPAAFAVAALANLLRAERKAGCSVRVCEGVCVMCARVLT